MREPDFLMAETIEKSSCIRNGHFMQFKRDFLGSLSNGVDDLENFTSEMEWSFFVPVGFSGVFSNWYSYVSTPPAFPLAWIHV